MKNKFFYHKIAFVLVLITIVGFVARFYGAGQGPGGLNRDEAALAYNSYLLAETGKDEWERVFPIGLESFGDFKLIGYPLLLVPLFKIVQFNSFSDLLVRLPSILAGTLLIPLSFYFARRLRLSNNWSLLFSLLIATTPIFIFYSRFAFESNVALTLLIGSFLLLTASSKNSKISAILKLLGIGLFYGALCTYNTPLLLVPTLILLIVFVFGFRNWKQTVLPILGISIVSLVFLFQTQDLLQQKKGITVFTDATVYSQYPAFREQFSGLSQTVFGNSKSFYTLIIADNVLQTFSPKFLALQGGAHPWHSLAGYGHLFMFEYVFSVIGVLTLCVTSLLLVFRSRHDTAMRGVFVSLVVLFVIEICAVLPSAITVDAPHATRSLFSIYFLLYLALSGYQLLLSQKSWKISQILFRYRLPLLVLIILIQLSSTILYVSQLNTHHKSQVQASIYPGLETFLRTHKENKSDQKQVVYDESGYLYIVFAWYDRIIADEFFATIRRHSKDSIGFSYGSAVGRFEFISDDSSENGNVLMFSDEAWQYQNAVVSPL